MGAWSPAILGNDTSCEVKERFFELYDSGEEPKKIISIVLEEQKDNLQYDETNVWLGLALACWECKALTPEIIHQIKTIIVSKKDIEFNKQLGANTDFLRKRQKALEAFIIKISTEKDKPRLRKKLPKQLETIYIPGQCLTYKNPQGKYIGIFLTESEYTKNKGQIGFFFLDMELDTIPKLTNFRNSKVVGIRKAAWLKGNVYQSELKQLAYEKSTKDLFFQYVPKLLMIIGSLAPPNKDQLLYSRVGVSMKLNNTAEIIAYLEENKLNIQKNKYYTLDITLGELINNVGVK